MHVQSGIDTDVYNDTHIDCVPTIICLCSLRAGRAVRSEALTSLIFYTYQLVYLYI